MHTVFEKTHELAQAILSSSEYTRLISAQDFSSSSGSGGDDDANDAERQIASRNFNDMMAQMQQLLNFLLYSDIGEDGEDAKSHCSCQSCNGCGKLH